MKTTVTKNIEVAKNIDFDNFYSVTFSEYGINLQGYLTEKTVAYVKQTFKGILLTFETHLTGAIIFEETQIRICLTIKPIN